jgi:kynureninase
VGPCRAVRFTPDYRPAAGITRYLCGTPPVLSMAALECGVDTLLAAEPLGGMAALRAKSLALTDLFIAAGRARCGGHGLRWSRRATHAQRGSQVCLPRARRGRLRAIVQALIARGVIGDFRAGDGGLHARHPALRLHAAVHRLRRRVGRRGAPAPGARHRRMARGPNSTRSTR